MKSAVYEDADGAVVEQEADVFLLACGAVESARLLLLSRSGRFPNGLANGSDLVGRNVTFHEYSAAIGAFDDPIYAWAGGGYVSASSFQFYEHDDAAASSRAAISRRPASASRCRSTGAAGPAELGRGGQADRPRATSTIRMAVAMVLHDMPQHDNRVDLDDSWSTPGACRSPASR